MRCRFVFLAVGLWLPTVGSTQGLTWVQVTPKTSPAPRYSAAMAYDASRQKTVMFGGSSATAANLAETWEYDGSTWLQRKPQQSPAARTGPVLAYDSRRRRCVLFGGMGKSLLNDTWEWDGQNWTQIRTTRAPSARAYSVMVYDSARGRCVLFSDKLFGTADTWEYDGTNWTQRHPQSTPKPRHYSAMAYDVARRRTVLCCGYTGSAGDTWEWDGTNWTERKPKLQPSARLAAAMVYDTARLRCVMFGGAPFKTGGQAETWEWDGSNWAGILPTKIAAPRIAAMMAFDSVRQRTVLFGGLAGRRALGDTWEYGFTRWTMMATTPTIPIAQGGTQRLLLDAGPDLKNKPYWIFGSASATTPGLVLGGVHVPLRPDPYTDLGLTLANTSAFTRFRGTLNQFGRETAELRAPAGLPVPKGFRLYHSFVVYDATTGQLFTSSNPVTVEFR